MNEYQLAFQIARKFHAGQMYGKESYMYHLSQVANSLSDENDDRLPIIGILHDILEDTDCTATLLLNLFDKDIVEAVQALTKRSLESYEDYIDKVRGNPLALTVKLHDTLCNLTESTKRRDNKRILKYSKQLQLLVE
jgi:(p)ppGpp synthase/HD superfamily hydrolase